MEQHDFKNDNNYLELINKVSDLTKILDSAIHNTADINALIKNAKELIESEQKVLNYREENMVYQPGDTNIFSKDEIDTLIKANAKVNETYSTLSK